MRCSSPSVSDVMSRSLPALGQIGQCLQRGIKCQQLFQSDGNCVAKRWCVETGELPAMPVGDAKNGGTIDDGAKGDYRKVRWIWKSPIRAHAV